MNAMKLTVLMCGLAVVLLSLGAIAPVYIDNEQTAAPLDVAEIAVSPIGSDGSQPARDRLSQQVRERTNDPKVYASLALLHLRDARASANPAFLTEAEALLRRALEIETSPDFATRLGLASLSNARHDFRASVRWSREAITLNPHNASPYGLLGDALFELGRYERADSAYQEMVDLRPDLASYVRASYALQFQGDVSGGKRALHLALAAAGPVGEEAAWVRHQLGDIYLAEGRLNEAARQNRIGTKLSPGYVPPTVGLAEVAIARGDLEGATELLEIAVERLPSLEYLIKLGDLYVATGRDEKAALQYQMVADRLALYRSHGVGPDVDFLLFYADRGLRTEDALAEARAVFLDRPTAAAADALAWSLYKSGKPRAAWRYSRRALLSPMPDGGFHLHAAMIARALGRESLVDIHRERALALAPTLSVVASIKATCPSMRLDCARSG